MGKKYGVERILKTFFLFIFFFYILYPIFAILGGIFLAIMHIIFGGNGDLGTALIETAGFAWTYWKITLFILFISAIFIESKLKEEVPSGYYKIKEKLTHPLLYAKKVKKASRRTPAKEKKVDDKKEEIKLFFEALQRKKEQIAMSYRTGTELSNTNYNMFHSVINDTKESLNILCWRVDEKLLSEMLWSLKNKEIKVIIITKNRTNKGYLNEFKNYCSNLKLELVHRNKIHAKIIIKDEKVVVVGSSNITESSMSESEHFLDCNIITKHKETVENVIDLFKSIYHNKDYTKKNNKSKLMYSRYSQDCLPFSLRPYFEKENAME